MAYDPNWLQKAKAKQISREINSLSHIEDKSISRGPFEHSTMLCGKGWGAKGYPSITVCQFPSITNLPTCYSCRIKFLASIGVEYNEKGYPVKH